MKINHTPIWLENPADRQGALHGRKPDSAGRNLHANKHALHPPCAPLRFMVLSGVKFSHSLLLFILLTRRFPLPPGLFLRGHYEN